MKMHGNMKCCTASLGLWISLVQHGVALHLHMTWLQVEWWVWKFRISKEPVFWNGFGFHPWNWNWLKLRLLWQCVQSNASRDWNGCWGQGLPNLSTLFQFSIFWNLPLTATAAWLWRKVTLTSSVDWMRNSRQTAKSLESKQNGQQWNAACSFISYHIDVLNAGKSGVQVQLENGIDLMSSLRHPGTLRLLYDFSKLELVHLWMHLVYCCRNHSI